MPLEDAAKLRARKAAKTSLPARIAKRERKVRKHLSEMIADGARVLNCAEEFGPRSQFIDENIARLDGCLAALHRARDALLWLRGEMRRSEHEDT